MTIAGTGGLIAIYMSALQKNVMAAALLAAMATGIYQFHKASVLEAHVRALDEQRSELSEQVRQLRSERDAALKRSALGSRLALHLPAPPLQLTAAPAAQAEQAQATNLFGRLDSLKNKAPNRLYSEQLKLFLEANGRNAGSLLAAYHTTGDAALLAEAMEKFPGNPQVALDALLRKGASAEERGRWSEAFKESDPNNALPNYFAALHYLESGQADKAIPELLAASAKHEYRDYSRQHAENDAQAYLAAGYSTAEARAMHLVQEALIADGSIDDASSFAPLQSLATFEKVKALAVSLRDLAKSYQQAGDPSSAQAALEITAGLGQRYDRTADGFSQLVGTAAEAIALRGMDPASAYGNSGQTVQDRLIEIKKQRAAVQGLYMEAAPLLGTLSEEDWTTYSDRLRAFGEPAALQWVVGKHGR